MDKQPSPLFRARQALEAEIDRARARNQSRLPTVLQLARTAGVSHETMRKVVARLRQQGIVDVMRSRGIVIRTGLEGQAVAEAVAKLRWQRLKEQLYRDLIDGTHDSRDVLPSRKELANRYAVTNRTLDKALRALHASGVLVPHKKSYKVAHSAPRAQQDTILLFARSLTGHQLARFTPRITEYYYALERTCRSHGVRLQVILCYTIGDRLVFDAHGGDTFTADVDMNRVLGSVIWHIQLDAWFTLWLAQWLSRFGRPVAYYFDIIEKGIQLPSSSSGQVRSFGVESNYEAGRRLGQFLLANGHRRAACFYNRPDWSWQTERIEGLHSAFAQAGIADGIRVLKGEAGDDSMLARRATTSTILGAIEREEQVRYRAASASELYQMVYSNVIEEQVSQSLEPLMRQAVSDRTITAWVGVNDSFALECLRFLRDTGTRVPDHISVVGFDNSFEAASAQMTSFDFNGAGAMRMMVDYLLRPNTALNATPPSDGPLLLAGLVHERGTTQRIAGAGR